MKSITLENKPVKAFTRRVGSFTDPIGQVGDRFFAFTL